MKRLITTLAMTLIWTFAASASQDSTVSAEQVTQDWFDSLRTGDYESYLSCIVPFARSIGEVGSQEAFEFWKGEFATAHDAGFVGNIEVEYFYGDSSPLGFTAAMAHFLDGDNNRSGNGLSLVKLDGRWWALLPK